MNHVLRARHDVPRPAGRVSHDGAWFAHRRRADRCLAYGGMSPSNGRRVAVTGMGFITPLGNDAGTVWSNILNGKSGVGPITRFDPSGHATRIAAEVKEFVPEDFM